MISNKESISFFINQIFDYVEQSGGQNYFQKSERNFQILKEMFQKIKCLMSEDDYDIYMVYKLARCGTTY
jgi:anaerobic ribonucleoside-triphosphate reductase